MLECPTSAIAFYSMILSSSELALSILALAPSSLFLFSASPLPRSFVMRVIVPGSSGSALHCLWIPSDCHQPHNAKQRALARCFYSLAFRHVRSLPLTFRILTSGLRIIFSQTSMRKPFIDFGMKSKRIDTSSINMAI